MSNVFTFTGTVVRDAEVRYTPQNQAVLTVTVANNTGYGDKQKTMWLRCTLWGKRAEGKLVDYLKKGQQVFVSGEFSQHDYQAKDGNIKTSLEVNCTVLDLVGGKKDSGAAPASQAPSSGRDNFDDGFNDPF